jgi:DNA-binding transcriptional regulator YiaG
VRSKSNGAVGVAEVSPGCKARDTIKVGAKFYFAYGLSGLLNLAKVSIHKKQKNSETSRTKRYENMAIDAIRLESMKIREAARVFGVPKSSLQRKLR